MTDNRSMQCSLFTCPAIMISRIWRGAKSWRAVAGRLILLVACLPARLGFETQRTEVSPKPITGRFATCSGPSPKPVSPLGAGGPRGFCSNAWFEPRHCTFSCPTHRGFLYQCTSNFDRGRSVRLVATVDGRVSCRPKDPDGTPHLH